MQLKADMAKQDKQLQFEAFKLRETLASQERIAAMMSAQYAAYVTCSAAELVPAARSFLPMSKITALTVIQNSSAWGRRFIPSRISV